MLPLDFKLKWNKQFLIDYLYTTDEYAGINPFFIIMQLTTVS